MHFVCWWLCIILFAFGAPNIEVNNASFESACDWDIPACKKVNTFKKLRKCMLEKPVTCELVYLELRIPVQSCNHQNDVRLDLRNLTDLGLVPTMAALANDCEGTSDISVYPVIHRKPSKTKKKSNPSTSQHLPSTSQHPQSTAQHLQSTSQHLQSTSLPSKSQPFETSLQTSQTNHVRRKLLASDDAELAPIRSEVLEGVGKCEVGPTPLKDVSAWFFGVDSSGLNDVNVVWTPFKELEATDLVFKAPEGCNLTSQGIKWFIALEELVKPHV